VPDRTGTDPRYWCPPCAAGNCPERCEEGCHHVCDIEALWGLAAAALHDRLYGYPVGDHREGPQWDEAQALAGLILHAISDGWAKVGGEWRPQRSLGSRLRFVLHARRCADLLSTWARALHRKGSHLAAPEGELEQDDCSRKTLIHLDTSVRPGGIDRLFLEDLGDDELDGLACVDCGRRGDPMVPVAQGPRGRLFACEHGCGQGPGYTESPLDWDPDTEPCSTCRGVGSACTCCQNCGAPNGRGRFGFCNGCAPFFDPHDDGCTCGDCPQNWGANG
jgi:hypothetical protein